MVALDIMMILPEKWRTIWKDRRVFVAVAAVLGTGALLKLLRWILLRHNLNNRRRLKQRQCQEAFDNLTVILAQNPKTSPEKNAEIMALTFTELQAALKDGQLTPTQVLYAYQTEALKAHRQCNCLQEPFKEAESWALELEAQNNRDLPLYGIPVSIKDGYAVKGYDCTMGLARNIGKPFSEDSALVEALKSQGAIPFVRTNAPQLFKAFETSNPIHGVTTNPVNPLRSAGGSSGGEGALLAAGGSILGIGGDIGGSMRTPCTMCGVCSIKPTQMRLGEKGLVLFASGQTFIRVDYGPMAQEVDALVAALRVFMSPVMFDLDPTLPRVTFDEQMYGSKRLLRVGYYVYDGVMHVVPACERAVREAVDKLPGLGHEVVEWDFSKYGLRIMKLWAAIVFGDGWPDAQELLEGDKIDPCLNFFMLDRPRFVRSFLAYVIGWKYPYAGSFLKAFGGVGSVRDWWQIGADLKLLRQEVFEEWRSFGFDVVISPGFCTPALPHGVAGKILLATSYTAVYNALHCPVGVQPVSVVKKEDLDNMDTYPTPDPWHTIIKEAQEGSEGLPLGVQVAALPWHDELCLRVMKELETALR